MPSAPLLHLFAACAPGLEPIVERELHALGIGAEETEAGGVAFTGGPEAMYGANLHLRTASRVLLRVGAFRAETFAELERLSRRLPWERFVPEAADVRLRVTCKKSRLYHSDAVADRVAGSIERTVRGVGRIGTTKGETADEESGSEAQLVVVRFFRDVCTISVDTSGALLHQRGYRLAVAKAPLRETLAAALLLASGWDGSAPLVDPMCGSGTIPIEGALIARRIPPGLQRAFAFERWPDANESAWRELRARAEERVLPASPVRIVGADRDAGAIEAATANAARAGVAGDVEFVRRPLSATEPAGEAGWLGTNPPYGVRVGERDPLRDLFARLGQVARERLSGWRLAMISAVPELDRQLRLPQQELFRTTNGGIPVRATVAKIPTAKAHDGITRETHAG